MPENDQITQLLARFRAILRPDVAIVAAARRPDGNLDATIRLSDGREGRFIVVFLDQDDDEPGPSHVLIVEDAPDHPSSLSVARETEPKVNPCQL